MHPPDDLLHGPGLVLAQNHLGEFIVLGEEDDVVLEHLEKAGRVEKGFDLGLVVAGDLLPPVEHVLAGGAQVAP